MRSFPRPAVLVALVAALPLLTVADTLTVTTEVDSVSGSLREAITTATSGDTIVFQANLSGALIRLTGGTLEIDKDLTIDASSLAERVQISGDTNGNGRDAADVRVTEIESGSTVTLRFLTVRDGYTPTPPWSGGIRPRLDGAGIRNFGNLTLEDCLITGNQAGDGAPGIDTGQSFDEAGLDGGRGGGIAHQGTDCIIRNSIVTGNEAGTGGPSDFAAGGRGGRGGGIFSDGFTLLVENSLIEGNQAGNGGVSTVAAGGVGGFGGGIDHSRGFLTILNSTLTGNVAGSSGAGVSATSFSGGGGGIYASNQFTIRNVTITGNSVPAAGNGGIMIGGGLGFGSSGSSGSVLANTILAGNTVAFGGTGPDMGSLNDTIPSLEGVLLIGENTDLHPFFLPGMPNADGHFVGSSFAPIDPLLGPLQDNGGPTHTRKPLPGSVAIDPVGGDTTTSTNFDQRGLNRLVGDSVDIGAVEVE